MVKFREIGTHQIFDTLLVYTFSNHLEQISGRDETYGMLHTRFFRLFNKKWIRFISKTFSFHKPKIKNLNKKFIFVIRYSIFVKPVEQFYDFNFDKSITNNYAQYWSDWVPKRDDKESINFYLDLILKVLNPQLISVSCINYALKLYLKAFHNHIYRSMSDWLNCDRLFLIGQALSFGFKWNLSYCVHKIEVMK